MCKNANNTMEGGFQNTTGSAEKKKETAVEKEQRHTNKEQEQT